MADMTRKEVLKMISERIVQAIVLSNHLADSAEPHADYVNEKINSWPVMDKANQDIFNEIRVVLIARYGIEIHHGYYG